MRKFVFLMLWILVFSIPMINIVFIPGLATATRIIGFGAVFAAVFYVIANKRVKEPSLFILLTAIYILWSLLSYLWSINPGATIGRFVTNIQLFAMVWLIWELCDTQERRNYIVQAFILGAYVSISDMVFTYIQGQSSLYRMTATNFNANEIANSLALGIPLAWYLILTQKGRILYWINFLYLPLSLFCIILTASRGGMLVAIIGLLVIPLTYFHIEKSTRTKITGFIVVGMIAIILLLPRQLDKIERNIERISGTPQALQEGNLNYRQVIWSAGWKVFTENPIIGIGSRGFRYSVEEYLYKVHAPHNAFLSVLVDTGIIGFILFVASFIVSILPNLQLKPPDIYIYFSFVYCAYCCSPPSWMGSK
jgi:O-antigen ligase